MWCGFLSDIQTNGACIHVCMRVGVAVRKTGEQRGRDTHTKRVRDRESVIQPIFYEHVFVVCTFQHTTLSRPLQVFESTLGLSRSVEEVKSMAVNRRT